MAIINNPTQISDNRIILCDKNIITEKDGSLLSQDSFHYILEKSEIIDFFSENEFQFCVAEIKSFDTLKNVFRITTIREFYATHDETQTFLVSRAKALINWRKNTVYCSCCGTKLNDSTQFSAKECPQCKKIYFPRIEPCIIVLVNKGDKILLARHTQRNQDIYACIAGFMEAGETAEHAVRREIFEETGLHVKNIQYRGSQSWPFPSQLMLGFTAEYESGEINIQKEELSDAQWFDRNNCPSTPMPGSIAYRLINHLY